MTRKRRKLFPYELLEHYETRTSVLEGKAMVVAMSREICPRLFDEIIKLRPEWAGTKLTKDGKDIGWNREDGPIRIVMTGKKRGAEQKHSALKQILDNAVKAEDVQDIFKMAGLERPNIGLLSDAFLEDVRRMERKNGVGTLLSPLLRFSG